MYHNRGDSSFVGENSVYGDFFGLDDLFTERPEVVDGMIEIFKPWVDLGVDGFRIDTMKHVNVEFWQQWAPAIETYAKEDVGNEDFFMFGEVFSANEQLLSMFTTKGEVQSVLDFGFQDAAKRLRGRRRQRHRRCATSSPPTTTTSTRTPTPTACRRSSATTTWAASATSSPSGNPGRDGRRDARPRPARALPHVLLAAACRSSTPVTSRASPAAGGRQVRPPGHGPQRHDRSTSTTTRSAPPRRPPDDNFDTDHPLYTTLTELAAVKRDHVALRSGAQLQRYAADGPGVLAFSRVDREERVEYLVVSNNAEGDSSATFATGTPGATFTPLWSTGRRRPR